LLKVEDCEKKRKNIKLVTAVWGVMERQKSERFLFIQ